MKKNRMQISTLLTLLLCMLLLTACGASAAESEGTDPETPPQESAELFLLSDQLSGGGRHAGGSPGRGLCELPDGDDHDADGQPHGEGPGGPLLPD